MDYKEKKGSYASDSSEKEYKEKEYILEKQEDLKEKSTLPKFKDIFYDLPPSGIIASFSDFHKGAIYFSSMDSHVYSVDSENGDMLWKFKTGNVIVSTPLVHNNHILFGSNDGNFYCLDLDGRLVWKKHLGDIVVSSPSAIGDKIFVGNGKGVFFCLSEDGNEIWRFKTGDGIIATPTAVNGLVFAVSYDKFIYALDMNGSLAWKFMGGERSSTPIVLEKNEVLFDHWKRSWQKMPQTKEPELYTGSYDNHTYRLDIDGNVVWKFNCGSSIPAGIDADNGTIYAGTVSHILYAIDAASGGEKWRFRAGGMIIGGCHARNGNVVFGCLDHKIYCILNGELLWSFLTNGPIVGGCNIVGNDLYFGSSDSFFYCIDMKERSVKWKFQVGFGLPESIKNKIKGLTNELAEYDRKIFKVWKPETAAGKLDIPQMMTGYNIPQGFTFGGESAYKATNAYKSADTPYKSKKSPYKK